MAIIPVSQIPEAQARVDKLNRRAAKLGVEGVTLDVSEAFEYEFIYETRDYATRWTTSAVVVTAVGPQVKLDGWTFLAAIDHFENLVSTTPDAGDTNLRPFVDRGSVCDHCGTNRDRKHTYIVRSDDGELTQVGSTCIKDFLGHDVNLHVAFFAVDDLDAEFESFAQRTPTTAPLSIALRFTATVVRHDGWASRGQSDPGMATADTVTDLLFNPRLSAEVANRYEITDEDIALATAAQEWAQALTVVDNDYLANLHQISTNDFVTVKSLGLAASMISAYRRAVEFQAEREREVAESSPVPVTEDRLVIEGTVVNVTWKEGFGYYDEAIKKITVRDDRGFKVWGTCPSKISQADQGDRVRFSAKVEVGDRDPSFGFFKRPTKPELLVEEVA